jgi:hypothetical protein
MRRLSLFLACQHLISGTNPPEREDQSWFKVQEAPVFRFNLCKVFLSTQVEAPSGLFRTNWMNCILEGVHCYEISLIYGPQVKKCFSHGFQFL